MATSPRQRLARVVRRADADLAELALCISAQADDQVDVDQVLLRIDALADGLRTAGTVTGEPDADAQALVDHLHGALGFAGNHDDYYDPANGLLHQVLDRRRGLPITLSVLYVAVARRVGIPAWGIAMPGHYYVGVGSPDRPIVLDPFDGGQVVTEAELGTRVAAATAGQSKFTRAHLRPASPALTTRRILDNLTRDFTTRGDLTDALWTVDTKLLLPNTLPDDHRVRGELLTHLGRYGEAADSFEVYLDTAGAASDAEEVRARAVRARAKLN